MLSRCHFKCVLEFVRTLHFQRLKLDAELRASSSVSLNTVWRVGLSEFIGRPFERCREEPP